MSGNRKCAWEYIRKLLPSKNNQMNVLIIGSGSREHTLAWAIRNNPRIDSLFVAPGNAGTADIATNLDLDTMDNETLLKNVKAHDIDLTVVGPESPLSNGIVDRFQELGLRIFGPTQAAAELESSKAFAKDFMQRNGIPTADGLIFDSHAEASRFIEQHDTPLVVKADGLAAGKGVTVALTKEDAFAALNSCMKERRFGSAGDRVVIEECLTGREVSVFVFTDGQSISPSIAACDYKRAYDGNIGPNTGGMGSYSPPEFWNNSLAKDVEKNIIQPTIDALAKEGRIYKGVLYAGLMLTEKGPKVIEFNCRLGDPETQVIIPLLETDLIEIVDSVLEGDLTRTPIQWSSDSSVGIVITSGGYPYEYEKGNSITGFDHIEDDALVFHGGTRIVSGKSETTTQVVTNGGRVMTVVGRGSSIAVARKQAYKAAQQIKFHNSFYRNDIALHLNNL